MSPVTRSKEAMIARKRECARKWFEKVNESLTFEKMRAATPLDELPYYYYPDRPLHHFPPKWYLGFLITLDNICKFAQEQNLAVIDTVPSDEDRRKAWSAAVKYLRTTWHINASCYPTIEAVYADTSNTLFFCLSICSNWNAHLCPDDALDDMETRLLELWAFTKPKLAWYLDGLGNESDVMDGTEETEWPLDFSLVWEQKYQGEDE